MTSKQSPVITLPYIGTLTYREIHAAVDGFYCGVHDVTDDSYNEYERERHYWRVGWLLGDFYDQNIRDTNQ